jgi:hypothetical protein
VNALAEIPNVPNTLKFPEVTQAQWAVLQALTDQRCANLMEAADFIADLPEETKNALMQGDKETWVFLRRLRPEELGELGNAIENARAFRKAGKMVRWSIVTLFGAFVGMSVIWDKISFLWKSAK